MPTLILERVSMVKPYIQLYLALALITLLTLVAEAEGTPTAIFLLEVGLAVAIGILGLSR